MENKLDISLKCIECNHESSVGIESNRDENIAGLDQMTLKGDGEALTVKFFACPECGRINVVQLDNDETSAKLESEKSLLRDAAYQKRRGGRVKKNQSEKIKAAQNDLAQSRKLLSDKYNGRILYSPFGVPVEVVVNDGR